jgi:hypothetical protein
MIRSLKICTLAFIAFFLGCTVGTEIKDGGTVVTNQSIKGTPLHINLTRGSAWGAKVKMGSLTLRVTPQIALWVEDSSGNLKQNIYVTHCFAKQDWKFLKSHPDSTNRKTSLPYWMNKMVHAAQPLPTKANPLPDAVTSATPTGSFSIETHIDPAITHGTIWCEFNSSFDNNETYTKDRPESFNGQPSLLFSGEFNSLDTSNTVVMTYRGHGGEIGSDSALYQKDTGITTAKQIITKIQFEAK